MINTIYYAHIPMNAARAEGRAPDLDNEYLALYWRAGTSE